MKQNHYKIVGIVVLVLFALSLVSHKNWLAYIAIILGVLAYSSEWFAKQFADKWMKFGKIIGNFNAGILLSLFFIFFLTPLALARSFFKKKEIAKTSTWKEVEKESFNFEKAW